MSSTIKRGTLVMGGRLTGNPDEIEFLKTAWQYVRKKESGWR